MFRWLRLFTSCAILIILVLVFTACIVPQERYGTPSTNGVSPTLTSATKDHLDSESLPITAQPESSPAPSSVSAIALSDAIADVVEQVRPAVVFILAKTEGRDFFNRPTTHTSSGSGVVVSTDGYIVTNNHVVRQADVLQVTLPDVRGTLEADLIGTDPLTDLAVIKIKGNGFPTAPFGGALNLRPGNLVIALGNPLGLEGGPTITLGVVSNTERAFNIGTTTFYDVIQTDAAINPGNSGGPLVNLSGEVVGINTILAGGAQNIGFAISATTAQPVYETLTMPPHRMIRPWLGISFGTITPDLAAEHGLSRQTGVLVAYVVEGSPADRAGIKVGDVITHFDGEEFTEATRLIKALWQHGVGEEVEITFWSGGRERTVVVRPVERPDGS